MMQKKLFCLSFIILYFHIIYVIIDRISLEYSIRKRKKVIMSKKVLKNHLQTN